MKFSDIKGKYRPALTVNQCDRIVSCHLLQAGFVIQLICVMLSPDRSGNAATLERLAKTLQCVVTGEEAELQHVKHLQYKEHLLNCSPVITVGLLHFKID